MKINRLYELELFLSQAQYASIDDLLSKFNVSIQTLRRDLNELEKRNVITKIYGGVIYNKDNIGIETTVSVKQRKNINTSEKIKICEIAAKQIDNNDIIFIDSGSTTIHLIPFLKDKTNITIVTHSLDIMEIASHYSNLTVIGIGGNYHNDTRSFYSDTNNFRFNFNKCFMTTTGISLPRGLTNENFYEAAIKAKAIQNSVKSYVLADHSKFGVITFNNYCTLDNIYAIVTDRQPDDLYVNHFKRNGIFCYF